MARRRRSFVRQPGSRRYKRLIVIASEGDVTEPQYFALMNSDVYTCSHDVHIVCLPPRGKSAPRRVLSRLKRYLKENPLRTDDAAWLVVDTDSWDEAHLRELHEWASADAQRGLAVSNPGFEYWLLLHFEEGSGITTLRQCVDRLRRYLPGFEKTIDRRQISLAGIQDACRRADTRDHPRCAEWPDMPGQSTVYRLVRKIID